MILILAIFMWEKNQTRKVVISAVLPKEFQEKEKEWIKGIKMCSKDLGFQIDFFFEGNEKEIEEKVLDEKNRKVSAVITKKNFDKEAEDELLSGYEMTKRLAQNSRKVRIKEDYEQIKIGIAIYDGKDSFIKEFSENMQEKIYEIETKKPIRIVTAVEDADGKQQNQDGQIEYLMEQGCDIILVNPVDTWSASRIIHRAKEEKIPIVFFNREPSDEDMMIWDQVYYVGSDGKNLGQLQGEILKEAFYREGKSVDKNQDGILQYILIEGEEGHSDSIRRTDAMHKKVKEDFPLEQISAIPAQWKRETAKDYFLKLEDQKIQQCEAVVCNNDDMALGILDALKEKSIAPYPVLIGVNGSQEALKEVRSGQMYGTVSQNSKDQIEKIIELVLKLWKEEEIKDPQKIYIPGQKETTMSKK